MLSTSLTLKKDIYGNPTEPDKALNQYKNKYDLYSN